jgi:hypothetical protein
MRAGFMAMMMLSCLSLPLQAAEATETMIPPNADTVKNKNLRSSLQPPKKLRESTGETGLTLGATPVIVCRSNVMANLRFCFL